LSDKNDFMLEFEKPVKTLENQIKELKEASKRPGIDISKEIKALEKKVSGLTREIYGNLNSWERVQLSRHPNRPHTVDYIQAIVRDFHEVCGDRKFANDPAMITGFGYIADQKFAIIGIEKGRKTKEKMVHNFGMPRPEGYRKALRVMKLAEQFQIPIVTFIDTPGAYPGIGAEERGQAEAIAFNLEEMFNIKVPIIAIVIGEGGSGGALAIGIADKVFMQEYSVYSVISPESCASILWADPKLAETAANSLDLGPQKALELKVIDGIIPEPAGGAHKEPEVAYEAVKETILKTYSKLATLGEEKLLENRFARFRVLGNDTLVTE
jgi:acetyl-CoA carboxylase carboxyl transferase subunit alpha